MILVFAVGILVRQMIEVFPLDWIVLPIVVLVSVLLFFMTIRRSLQVGFRLALRQMRYPCLFFCLSPATVVLMIFFTRHTFTSLLLDIGLLLDCFILSIVLVIQNISYSRDCKQF